jgi:hypothetical protein
MEFIAHDSDAPPQVKFLIEQGHSPPLGPFIGFFLAHENFDLTSQEAANRDGTLSGQDFGLLYRFSVKADRKVLFSVCLVSRHGPSYTRIVRVERI